jgi:uncharacterized protein YkwD
MTTPRIRSLVVSLTVSAMLTSLVLLTSAHARPLEARRPVHIVAADTRDEMLELVNRSRRLRGLPALRINERVSREALAHSRLMSRTGTLSHTPSLAVIIVRAGGTVFGEDVGQGRGLRWIRDAWLGQSDTREILLDSRFHQAGLGLVQVDGFFWVTLQAFD